jgi:hypothetical protein
VGVQSPNLGAGREMQVRISPLSLELKAGDLRSKSLRKALER